MRWLAVVLGLSALIGACGGNDESRARDTVDDYFEAMADQDAERVCDLMAPAGRRRLGTRCDQGSGEPLFIISWSEAEEEELREVRAGAARVDGDRATVALEDSRESVWLARIEGQWRIVAPVRP